MEQPEVAQLMGEIKRSIQMRQALHDRLARQEEVDLVEEWHALEQLDAEIAHRIRKRRPE
jgi:hypothetical protein